MGMTFEMILMGLGMVLFWVVLIVLAVWIVRLLFNPDAKRMAPGEIEKSPEEILKERFSRGEITPEQYLLMKEDLERSDSTRLQ